MSENVGLEVFVEDVGVEVLDDGPVLQVVLPQEVLQVVVPGPQGPANTDYQIGGTEPTDPNIKIWYKLTGA